MRWRRPSWRDGGLVLERVVGHDALTMDTKTGSIARFETDEDARRAGHLLKLTEEQAARLTPLERSERISEAKRIYGMNRQERRAEQRKMKAEARARKKAAR